VGIRKHPKRSQYLCGFQTNSVKCWQWLKNNRELINVATSRAKNKLVVIGSYKELTRLHNKAEDDDLFELVDYVRTNGTSKVTKKVANSRALDIRPYSSATEEAFMKTLNHALGNAFNDGSRYVMHKEVAISQVFLNNNDYNDFFYKGRFDFVVYQKLRGREIPVLAIELDGKEHHDNNVVMQIDQKKEKICHDHGFELIRVENSYARRYHYVKDIITRYFTNR